MKAISRMALALFLTLTTAPFAPAQVPAIQSATTHNTWSNGTPLPTAVLGASASVIKDQIYVVGGWDGGTVYADNQIYDPATNSWGTGAALPVTNYAAASAVVKNVLYIIGGTPDGMTVTNAVWAYNPKKNTWSSESPMPTARVGARAAVDKNIVYVIGGEDENFNPLATVESYDPATNTWTEEDPLLVAKVYPSVGLIGSAIVAADGRTAAGDTGDNEGYYVATDSWKSLTPDPTGRDVACSGSIGGYLYIAGGRVYGGGSGTPALGLVESFRLSKDTWATLASMPQVTQSPASAVYNDQLYCFGGQDAQGSGSALDNVQIYQP